MKKILSIIALVLTLPQFSYAISIGSISDNLTSNAPTIKGNPKGYMQDAAITAYLHTQLLLEKNVSTKSLSITTNDGVVSLSGTVDSEEQAQKIVRIASAVRGVKSVSIENLYVSDDG